MREFYIDPITKDRVAEGGSFRLADGAETAVLHALEIHLGGDWYLPGDGSRLHDLQAFTGASEEVFAAEVTRALEVLVRRGRITDVSVKVSSPRTGRKDITIGYTDARTGRAITVQR